MCIASLGMIFILYTLLLFVMRPWHVHAPILELFGDIVNKYSLHGYQAFVVKADVYPKKNANKINVDVLLNKKYVPHYGIINYSQKHSCLLDRTAFMESI